jgi:hypothetical protein
MLRIPLLDGTFGHLSSVSGLAVKTDIDKSGEGDFIALQRLVMAISNMIKACQTVSCLNSPLTKPATRFLTVSLQRPTSNGYMTGLRRTAFVERDNGVTIRDLLLLLAKVAISLFEGYAENRRRETDSRRSCAIDPSLMVQHARNIRSLLS